MEVRFFIPILAARELVFATITINKLAVMSLTTFPGAISILSKVSLFYGPSFCPLAKWINLNFDRRSDRSQVGCSEMAASADL
jgi:hypothetical protein